MTLDHPAILEIRHLRWPDEAGCAAHAAALATHPQVREAFIELHGPLGAGKTSFVRHLLRALGVGGRVKSPTYAVIETYTLPGLPISHIDLYRLSDPREWRDAGLRDVFAARGLKLVEWPTHAGGQLPVPDLRLFIEPDAEGDGRAVRTEACTPLGQELLA